tara:strand:- start:549 stop:1454 length:906 start_codon:yes stop_codon:yes gene_type:complete
MLNNIWKILFLVFLFSCANDSISATDDNSLVNQNNLDIITWNIEHYPKHSNTNLYLEDIINSIEGIDIIALQEIESSNQLSMLANNLGPEWVDFRYENSDWGELSYLINSETVSYQEPYSILNEYQYYFAYRPPYVLEFDYNKQQFILINVHYKCCGDGNLDEQDSSDEEFRRLQATYYLDSYISDNFPNSNVIIVGDFNDSLDDDEQNNVFNLFFNSSEYLFTDLPMALENNYWQYWSFPSWPSHLDHVVISNELFDEYENINSNCNTLVLDNFFSNGWLDYNNYISDHRPVRLSLDTSQ